MNSFAKPVFSWAWAKLYNIPPMEMPPHEDGPARLSAEGRYLRLHCLQGPMKLFLLGDEIGVGRLSRQS